MAVMGLIRSHVTVCAAYKVFTDTLAVVKERAKATAVQVIQDRYEKMFVELEGCWELQKKNSRVKSFSNAFY